MSTDKHIKTILDAWHPYFDNLQDWRMLIKNIIPKKTGCGLIYELQNPINRPDESFAIADMSDLEFSEPHYHINGETEIYIVLEGSGTIVVGCKESLITKHSILVTPPHTTHYTVPIKNLVLAVINTPPFNAQNYIAIHDSNSDVSFDKEQFERLKTCSCNENLN